MEEEKTNLDNALTEVMGGDNTTPEDPSLNDNPNPPETPENPIPEEENPTPEDPKPDEETPPQEEDNPEDPDDSQDSSVIKTLRNDRSKFKKEAETASSYLQKAAEAAGMTVEEYQAKLDNDAIKTKAEKQGITPEIQKQLDEQTKQIQQLNEQRDQANFIANLSKVQVAHSLDRKSMETFVNRASQAGFNLADPTIDSDLIYKALNYDSLVEKVKEETRQSVLKEIENPEAPTITKTGGNGPGGKKDNLNEALKAIGLN